MAGQKKILVISDTHGDYRRTDAVIEREKPFDLLIHCGDLQMELKALVPDPSIPVYAVKGNCDIRSDLPEVLTLRVGYYNLMVTHGHKYQVKHTKDILLEAARENFADVVLFGHTHVPVNYRSKTGCLVLNPGSLAFPQQFPREATYAVLTISDDALPSAEIKVL